MIPVCPNCESVDWHVMETPEGSKNKAKLISADFETQQAIDIFQCECNECDYLFYIDKKGLESIKR